MPWPKDIQVSTFADIIKMSHYNCFKVFFFIGDGLNKISSCNSFFKEKVHMDRKNINIFTSMLHGQPNKSLIS